MQQMLPVLAVVVVAILCLPLAGIRRIGLPITRVLARLLLLAIVIGCGILVFQPDYLTSFWEEWPANFRGWVPAMGSAAAGAWLAVLAGLILLPLIWMLDETPGDRTTADAPAPAAKAGPRAAPAVDGVRATDIRSATNSMTQAGAAAGRPQRVADYV